MIIVDVLYDSGGMSTRLLSHTKCFGEHDHTEQWYVATN